MSTFDELSSFWGERERLSEGEIGGKRGWGSKDKGRLLSFTHD